MGWRSTLLHQAEAGFDDGDGGGDGGFGAEDARAEVGEGKVFCAQQVALGGGPAAFGADGEGDGRDAGRGDVTYYVTIGMVIHL